MSDLYFVARRRNSDFVGTWKIDEIRSQHDAFLLSGSLFVTKSNGQSFKELQSYGHRVRWITVRELLSQNPPGNSKKPIIADNPSPAISVDQVNPDLANARLSDHISGGFLSSTFLVIAQFWAAMSAAIIPLFLLFKLDMIEQWEKQNGGWLIGSKAVLLASALIVFCLYMALLIALKRATTVALIARDQDAENLRLWLAISELRSSPRPQVKVDLKKVVPANPPEGT